MAARQWAGEDVDYLDGVMFSHPAPPHVGLAHRASRTARDYTGMQIFYRSIQHRRRDVLTTHGYLWRWDTDWFWCSGGLGVQHPVIRRVWAARQRRSDVYWKIVAFANRADLEDRWERWRGRPRRER